MKNVYMLIVDYVFHGKNVLPAGRNWPYMGCPGFKIENQN